MAHLLVVGLIVLAAWTLLALPLGVLVGRRLRRLRPRRPLRPARPLGRTLGGEPADEHRARSLRSGS
ncbi:hypothetical protein V2S66_01280 [Streptomyces sp. V4-01]|uniref:Uncharacterized protein n=1 Tax=Actinacidiphila polyblastidii TaxID=3110430 RepID=A0ABU7P458_9ACTN|nr:hypothetical protein [Streptomyces sp. V4-01]